MSKRQEGNGAVGVVVTVALIAFVFLWMWLAKNNLAPSIGFGVKISMPVLLGGLVVLVLVLFGLFRMSNKRSS